MQASYDLLEVHRRLLLSAHSWNSNKSYHFYKLPFAFFAVSKKYCENVNEYADRKRNCHNSVNSRSAFAFFYSVGAVDSVLSVGFIEATRFSEKKHQHNEKERHDHKREDDDVSRLKDAVPDIILEKNTERIVYDMNEHRRYDRTADVGGQGQYYTRNEINEEEL